MTQVVNGYSLTIINKFIIFLLRGQYEGQSNPKSNSYWVRCYG